MTRNRTNPTGPAVALKTAYDAVTQMLKMTPAKLIARYDGVTYPTLRRIRDGLTVKGCTHSFYMGMFMSLLRDEYNRRIRNGGDGSVEILRVLAEIGLQEHHLNLNDTGK